VLCFPQFKFASTASAGVPVKNYIDQSQELILCAFALALPALISLRERQLVATAAYVGLLLTFVVNMLFVVSARTALVYIPALLVLFASLHLNRSAMLALFAVVVVTIILVWSTSPYLRNRVANIATEYHAYESNTVAWTAQRLEFWVKSIRFVAAALLFGHGTGSTRLLFERDAVGQTGLRAEVSGSSGFSHRLQTRMLGVTTIGFFRRIHASGEISCF
jgi:O-antigen ligase